MIDLVDIMTGDSMEDLTTFLAGYGISADSPSTSKQASYAEPKEQVTFEKAASLLDQEQKENLEALAALRAYNTKKASYTHSSSGEASYDQVRPKNILQRNNTLISGALAGYQGTEAQTLDNVDKAKAPKEYFTKGVAYRNPRVAEVIKGQTLGSIGGSLAGLGAGMLTGNVGLGALGIMLGGTAGGLYYGHKGLEEGGRLAAERIAAAKREAGHPMPKKASINLRHAIQRTRKEAAVNTDDLFSVAQHTPKSGLTPGPLLLKYIGQYATQPHIMASLATGAAGMYAYNKVRNAREDSQRF